MPFARCFAYVPEQDAFNLLSDVIHPRNSYLHFYLSCRLVAAGHQPLQAINPAIEEFVPDADKRLVVSSVLLELSVVLVLKG